MPQTADRRTLETVARAWIALWRTPVDWETFDELHADDFEDGSAAGRPATKQGFAAGLETFAAAFPDLRTEVVDLVVDESAARVAVRWRAEGTNRIAYLGIGPTHRRTVIAGIEILEIRGHQLVRRWGEWDITAHREGQPS